MTKPRSQGFNFVLVPSSYIMDIVFQATIKPPLNQLYNKDRGGLVYLICG